MRVCLVSRLQQKAAKDGREGGKDPMAQQVQREGLQVMYRSQAASVSDVKKRGERRSKRLDERWYLAGRNTFVWWVVGGVRPRMEFSA